MVRIRALDPPAEPDPDPGIVVPGPLTVDGHQLLDNGVVVGPSFGLRVGSAAITNADFNAAMAMLDPDNPENWRAGGVRFVTFFFQGTSGGASRTFNTTGTGWNATAHQDADASGSVIKDRLHSLVQAAGEQGIIVILGLFYQGVSQQLANMTAFQNATALAVNEFGDYPHVIWNIANENNSWSPFDQASNVISCAGVVKAQGTGQLVGGGGYGRSANGDYSTTTVPLFSADEIDLLLYDTFNTGTCGFYFDDHMSNGLRTGGSGTPARKPAINVETFGGSTRTIHATQGAYTDEWAKLTATKGYYIKDADEAVARHSLGLVATMMHDNRWFQGKSITSGNVSGAPGSTSPSLPWGNRYDWGDDGLASLGTTGSRGIAWLANYHASLIA